MSVINDALKTAQRQRSEKDGEDSDQRFLEELFFHDENAPRRRVRDAVLLVVGAVAVIATTAAVYVRYFQPSPPPAHVDVAQAGEGLATVATRTPVTPVTADKSPARAAAHGPDTTAGPRHVAPALPLPLPSPGPTRSRRSAAIRSARATATAGVTVSARSARTVDSLFARAYAAHREGDLRRAEVLYAEAVATSAAPADLYNDYGALLDARGDRKAAIRMYRAALDRDRSHVNAWLNLAVALDNSGHRSESADALRRVLAIEPKNVLARLELAEQLETIDPSAARRLLSEAVSIDTGNAAAHYQLARLLEGEHDYAGARQALAAFIRLGADQYSSSTVSSAKAHLAALSARAP
jgi:tetratricopeptide (TPR) repeat protein